MQVSTSELENHYQIGNSISLQGYTSTSLNRAVAKSFAFWEAENESDEKCPLIIKIIIEVDRQLFYLSSDDYSAYPDEEEILLQDGVQYHIDDRYNSDEIIFHNGQAKTRQLTTVVLSIEGS